MRIEIAGAQVTDAVIDVLETLQTQPEIAQAYLRTIDELTRTAILDITAIDEESDCVTLDRLRSLQMIRRDIVTLSSPPDVDDPANDIPAYSG